MHQLDRRCEAISRCLAMVVAVACGAVSASAQTANADILQDSQRARIDAAVGTSRGSVVSGTSFVDSSAFVLSPAKAADFNAMSDADRDVAAAAEADKAKYSFTVLGYGDFNSNAQAARTQGTGSIEGDPQLLFGFTKRLSFAGDNALDLSGQLVAASDRFVRPVNGDGDSASADIRIQYANRKDDQAFAPFLDYGPSLSFAPTFASHTGTSQALTLGFDKIFNFSDTWKRVRRRPDSSAATTWSLGFTGSVARQFNESSASLYLISAQPSLTYKKTGGTGDAGVNASLAVDVVRRIDDRQGDVSEKDWVFQPILTAVLTPPLAWFGAQQDVYTRWGTPTLQAQIAFLQVDSNVASAQFHQWTVGPTITLSWGF